MSGPGTGRKSFVGQERTFGRVEEHVQECTAWNFTMPAASMRSLGDSRQGLLSCSGQAEIHPHSNSGKPVWLIGVVGR